MGAAQVEQAAREADQRMVRARPVEPGYGIVLRIGVVVAALGVADLRARPDHRGAARQQQRGEQVAPVPGPGGQDGAVLGRALDTVVPGEVGVAAVAVAFAVGLVVLAVVGHEVGEREAVVGRDEVDRSRWAALGGEEVGRARHAAGQGRRAGVAGPEATDVVAIPVVPLAPAAVEAAHLVAARADVPGFGDELQAAQHRVLPDGGDDGGVRVEALAAPAQHRHQIEPEAVDAAEPRPGAQRVEHQPHHGGVVGIEDVAAAGIVDVAAAIAGIEPVVGRVVEAAERQGGAEFVALARVVVDDVEQHLEPGLVQGRHGLAHFGPAARGEARLGRQQGHGVVAPEIGEAERPEMALVGPGHGGHDLERRDAERAEMRDRGRGGQAREGAADLLGHARVQLREAPHVDLGDAGPLPGGRARPGRRVLGRRHDGLRHGGGTVAPVGLGTAGGAVEHGLVEHERPVERHRVGVDEQLGVVEAVPVPRLPRAARPQPVAGAGRHAGDEAVEDLAGALRQDEARLLDLAVRAIEADHDRLGMGREDRHVDPPVDRRDAERLGPAGAGHDGRGSGEVGLSVGLHRPAWVDHGSVTLSIAAVHAGRSEGVRNGACAAMARQRDRRSPRGVRRAGGPAAPRPFCRSSPRARGRAEGEGVIRGSGGPPSSPTIPEARPGPGHVAQHLDRR